ncbi:MAG: hypothetical protein ACOC3W_11465 [Thermodesulfobacteriota bacterium]
MRPLLTLSTHPGEPELFNDDRNEAAGFLERWEFNGFEFYPAGDHPCEQIPADLITGLQLRSSSGSFCAEKTFSG